MDLGVRTWGNDPNGSTIMLIGTYLDRRRDQSPAPRRAPDLVVLRQRHVGLAADPAARRRDRERRARPGGRPRPPARPAAHRGAAGVVLASGGGGTGVVPRATATRSSGARCACCRTTRRTRGPSRRWPPRPASSRRRARPPVHRPRRRAADDVPHRLALALAADLLREPDATIGAVAQQVGYGSPFALSTAFKRVRGVSPKRAPTRSPFLAQRTECASARVKRGPIGSDL